MSVKVRARYLGDGGVELEHGPSRAKITTDLPADNGGRGRMFSPTDLLTGALASCILTIMAQAAEREGLDVKGASAEVEKEMSSAPRRVARFAGRIRLPGHLPPPQKERLRAFIKACPVGRSLHPDIAIELSVE